jgi:hypothetical protein
MKKILTLLLTVIIVNQGFSQWRDQGRNNNGGYGNDQVYNNGYPNNNSSRTDDKWYNKNGSSSNDRRYDQSSTSNQRDELVERVYREYQYKINAVTNSQYLKTREKRVQINQLENQRDQQIRRIYQQFKVRNRNDDRYNDRGYNYRR